MTRKFWIAWALCLVVLVGLFAITWVRIPNRPDATAGLVPGRIGLIALPTVIPLVYAAYRAARLRDPDGPASYFIPIGLAVALGTVGLFAGFIPDAVGCFGFNIERFGPLPPECMTADEARSAALVELVAMWVVFAFLAVVFSRRGARRRARRAPPR
ncbi:MAG: hypothetical protein ACRDKB_09325 [Actinomycetota bacterium]